MHCTDHLITIFSLLLARNKKIIVQRRRGFSMLLFPLISCQKKQDLCKSWIWILMGVHHALRYQFILCRLQGKDCRRAYEAVFWSTVFKMNLQEPKFFFFENIHSIPNLYYPIFHYEGWILTINILRIFKSPS